MTLAREEGRKQELEVVESSHAAIALYRRSGGTEVGRTSLALPDGRELRELVFAIVT